MTGDTSSDQQQRQTLLLVLVLSALLFEGLVLWLDQAWPGLVVGLLVAALAIKGGDQISRNAARADDNEEAIR